MDSPAQVKSGMAGLPWVPPTPELGEGVSVANTTANSARQLINPDSLYEPIGSGLASPVNPISPVAAIKTPKTPASEIAGLPPWLIREEGKPVSKPVTGQEIYPQVVQNVTLTRGIYYPKTNLDPMTTPMPAMAPVKPIAVGAGTVLYKPVSLIPPPNTMGGNILSQGEAGRKIASLFALIYWTIGAIYTLVCGLSTYVGLKYYLTVTQTGGAAAIFLKDFPWLGLLPLFYLLGALAYFWAGVYLKEGTRTGWILGLLIGIGIPILMSLLSRVWWSEVGALGIIMLESMAWLQIAQRVNYQGLFIWQVLFILPVVGLLLSFKAFGHAKPNYNQGLKSMIGLVTVFSIFLFGFILGAGYLLSYSNDFGYKDVQGLTNYKIYRPKVIPGQRNYSSNFIAKDNEGMLNGRTDFTQVSFDYPPSIQKEMGLRSPIILRQVGVEQGFASEAFAASLLSGTATPQAVLIQGAINNTGYTLDYQGTNGKLGVVVFDTLEGVLVFISSTTAPMNDLISLANNLD